MSLIEITLHNDPRKMLDVITIYIHPSQETITIEIPLIAQIIQTREEYINEIRTCINSLLKQRKEITKSNILGLLAEKN